MAADTKRRLFIGLELDASGLVKGIARAEDKLDDLGKTGKKTDKLLDNLRRRAIAFAAGFVGLQAAKAAFRGLISVARKAKDTLVDITEQTTAWEDAIVDLDKKMTRSLFDSGEKGFNKLSQVGQKFNDEILKMSKSLPQSAVEIAGVATAAAQLGVAEEDILSFTKTMLDFGITSDLTAKDGALALKRLANITGLADKDISKLANSISVLGDSFATSESEIIEMSLRIAGVGSTVGLTQAEIVAFATALSDLGVKAEVGGSSVSRVLAEIAKAVGTGSENLETFARVAGLSVDQFSQKFSTEASAAVIDFLNGLTRMNGEGQNAFTILEELGLSGVRVTDVLTRSSKSLQTVTDATATSNKAWQENNALITKTNAFYNKLSSAFETFKNRVKFLAVSIGGELLPDIKQLVEEGGQALLDLGPDFVEFTKKALKAIKDFIADNDITWMGFKTSVRAVLTSAEQVMKGEKSVFQSIGTALGTAFGNAFAKALKAAAFAPAQQIDLFFRNLLDRAFDLQGKLDPSLKPADVRDLKGEGRGFQDGGIVSGPKSGFPAILHGTEIIVPTDQGDPLKKFLEIVKGKLPGFRKGGMTGDLPSFRRGGLTAQAATQQKGLSEEDKQRILGTIKPLVDDIKELGNLGNLKLNKLKAAKLPTLEEQLSQFLSSDKLEASSGNVAEAFEALADEFFAGALKPELAVKVGEKLGLQMEDFIGDSVPTEKAEQIANTAKENIQKASDDFVSTFDAFESAQIKQQAQQFSNEMKGAMGLAQSLAGSMKKSVTQIGTGLDGMKRLFQMQKEKSFSSIEAAEQAIKNISELPDEVIEQVLERARQRVQSQGFQGALGAVATLQQQIDNAFAEIVMIEEGRAPGVLAGIQATTQLNDQFNSLKDSMLGIKPALASVPEWFNMAGEKVMDSVTAAASKLDGSIEDAESEIKTAARSLGFGFDSLSSSVDNLSDEVENSRREIGLGFQLGDTGFAVSGETDLSRMDDNLRDSEIGTVSRLMQVTNQVTIEGTIIEETDAISKIKDALVISNSRNLALGLA